ncbi:MAG: hypothetical protein AB7E72_04770 [Lysobacterales bacterium]
MAYTIDSALDFWYEFDQAFLFATSPEVDGLYATIFGPNFAADALIDAVRDHRADLSQVVAGKEPSFQRLAEIQLSIMDRHFPDPADLQRAFEDFGQGILFDAKTLPGSGRPRRPVGRLIHMMDGTPDDCIGYHRWHAFIRAAVAAGADAGRWLAVNRLVALAWAIYSELNPREDAPNNPPLATARLDSLRNGWLSADEATLNEAFLHYTGKFPAGYGTRRARQIDEVRYLRIQNILSAATSNSNPQHTGARRFWELPLAQFLAVQVYGNPLIAPKGPGRGAASSLVKVLLGTLPGFPRMPLRRPPLDAADIVYIENWIDNLEVA